MQIVISFAHSFARAGVLKRSEAFSSSFVPVTVTFFMTATTRLSCMGGDGMGV
jgi:hypothetical protein